MEAVGAFKTMVTTYQTTRWNKTDDSDLQCRCFTQLRTEMFGFTDIKQVVWLSRIFVAADFQ
jgi:hypothetical protein